MNWKILNRSLDSPAYKPESPNNPAVVAAAITGGAAVLNGIASLFGGSSSSSKNLKATRETNATNMAIADKVNQANYDLYKEQYGDAMNAWQMQTDSQRAYDNPAAEMSRLEAAGLNPALAFGQGAGADMASFDMPSAAPVRGYDVETPQYTDVIGNAVRQGLSAIPILASSIKSFHEAEGQRMDNQFADATFQSRMSEIEERLNALIEDNKTKPEFREFLLEKKRQLRSLNDLFEETYDSQVNSIVLDESLKGQILSNMHAQNENIVADTILKGIDAALKPGQVAAHNAQLRAVAANLYGQLQLLKDQHNLNEATFDNLVKTTTYRMYETLMHAGVLSMEFKSRSKALPFLEEQIRSSLNLNSAIIQNYDWQHGFGIFDRYYNMWDNASDKMFSGATMGLGRGFR